MSVVSTPCLRVCALDERREFCVGCGRTRAEIAAWSGMSETQRLAVMATLQARLATLSRTPPAASAAASTSC